MKSLLWRQFAILFWKNWIVLLKHPFLNFLRCFALPIGFGVFLAVAQLFLIKPSNFGIGDPVSILSLTQALEPDFALLWADGTDGTSDPSPASIISRITQNFTTSQLAAVRQLDSPDDIPAACPQNFNLFSECFAAIAFYNIPANGSATNPINYTIRADAGLAHIDVVKHSSDFEKRILPLQWAIDQAIIELHTGERLPTPFQWPFTQETNEERDTRTRLSYIRGLRTLLVLLLFVCFVGISYQLPGAVATERANLITAHMKAMGLLDSARILSWHLSVSLVYLPAWVIVALVWHARIFSKTNAGLVVAVHLLLGLSLASWSFFVAAPFGKSPQLAAVASTFLAIIFAIIALVFSQAGNVVAFIFTILFPPGYYIFAIRAMCGFENNLRATNVLQGDPDNGLLLLPLLIAAIVDIFLWPVLATLLERRLYDARNISKLRDDDEKHSIPDNVAVSIKNLGKTFPSSLLRPKKNVVTAVDDLTLDIPKHGIFVLLGSNGAGKSTVLSILGGLTGRTRGSVLFEGGVERPRPGTLGIVSQKNVLFPELTCYQTLRVWRAVKRSGDNSEDEDIEQLLKDCDLGQKIHANASTLSGGQKRKLQLAIGLIGGSKVVLVDECTSGVDPLSRRALWRTLTSFRQERTIIFTTHFLDEADLLADNIAILAAPGKLVASGSPVSLKRDLGEGYIVQVTFSSSPKEEVSTRLLHQIRNDTPSTYLSTPAPNQVSYHLRSKDSRDVERVLQILENEKHTLNIASYDVTGTTIEDIFLDLMEKNDPHPQAFDEKYTRHSMSSSVCVEGLPSLQLSNGRRMSPLQQAKTIFIKRALIARRSWLTPALSVLVAIAASTIPLVFIRGRQPSCVKTFSTSTNILLYLPISPMASAISYGAQVLNTPPGLISTLGNSTSSLSVADIPDNSTFVDTIRQNYRALALGGVSIDLDTGSSLLAWEATQPGLTGAAMLNLVSNIMYNNALNSTGQSASFPTIIQASYEAFPPIAAGTLFALKWVAFFGAAMSVYPAFYALYVSRERRSAVQAMQFSNGLSDPVGLWIGHLLFDTIFAVLSSTIIIIVFAAASNQFHGLGLLFLVMVLYGIASTLFAYCVSLVVSTPLAAFAAVTAYEIVMFVLYLAGYLLTLTYAKTSEANDIITIIHFTLSVLSPIANVTRAALVSVNLFSLLCTGSGTVSTSHMATIDRYGGPIVYLIIYIVILLGILVWVDSGSSLPRIWSRKMFKRKPSAPLGQKQDVLAEADHAASSSDLLRVLGVSKAFGDNKVVDDVTLSASPDTVFALLGPNGAGKTTTFNVIRGDVTPDRGDVYISGESVVHHPSRARFALGVCPQFTAIDSQLTVREHLEIYGRLKGLGKGSELLNNVDSLLNATALAAYADRLASKLSGGNQRKLSLAIALIGNPSVVLIDEFSTGVDARMKRDMWKTLRNVVVGKAVMITTHSMEEASALATKVGILAKRLLAVGTTKSLSARYPTYEVHFTCRTREEITKAQVLMAHIPGTRMADDVATRFEVPISDGFSLAQLFHVLSTHGDFSEYTVERATLESVFLKVIRENDVAEEDHVQHRRWWWLP
ncbi:hypothetical protein IW261DRAFT_1075379 [Armillaria novae-zelandiae]|uniref:ABC transporter domain-containing protein n=1 Tax=Armillaria novae-zelandiae TaxID=153914 RepID=A0AA39TDC3_9AGAR|nr:hypothetical protein IW261DRAFT_1075379 [Armillaria novae-zelandiae]